MMVEQPVSRTRRLLARGHRPRVAILAAVALVATVLVPLLTSAPASAAGPCGPPVVSVIACENTAQGDPTSDWQITGAGDQTIQGFATSMSASPGDTVTFKIKTTASSYHFDILRLGYYQGNGARKVASGLRPSATLPQTQPACQNDTAATGLIDCGNWAVSASWTVPSTAVSGVYLAHLVRDDTGGSSHIVFVVRNDASHSDVLFQTSDETWQAYNTYGGNSLYSCSVNCPPGSPAAYKGAAKVSYNRPFHSAEDDSGGRSWLMYAEYAMIRFLEANGYDVALHQRCRRGHGRGWRAAHQPQVLHVHRARRVLVGAAARQRGGRPGQGREPRVLQRERGLLEDPLRSRASRAPARPTGPWSRYKETHYDGVVDPQDPPTWTGTWEDPRFSPPADGGRPQNALTGQLFVVNSGTTDIRVPSQYCEAAVLAQHGRGDAALGTDAHAGAGRGDARLRVGHGA